MNGRMSKIETVAGGHSFGDLAWPSDKTKRDISFEVKRRYGFWPDEDEVWAAIANVRDRRSMRRQNLRRGWLAQC